MSQYRPLSEKLLLTSLLYIQTAWKDKHVLAFIEASMFNSNLKDAYGGKQTALQELQLTIQLKLAGVQIEVANQRVGNTMYYTLGTYRGGISHTVHVYISTTSVQIVQIT